MNDAQVNWLQSVSGATVDRADFAEREQQKDAILSKLSRDILELRDQILADMKGLKVQAGKKKQKVLDYKGRDQTKEFDLDEQQDGYVLTAEEDQQRLAEAHRLLSDSAQQLDAKDKNSDPLFDEQEIATELYKPLVRQGLVPETMVPDKFSETEEMRKGAFDLYKERLKEDEKGRFRQFLGENSGLGVSFLKLGTTGVGAVGTFGQAANVDPNDLGTLANTDKFANLVKDGKGFENTETLAGFVNDGMDLLALGKDGYDDAKAVKERFSKDTPEHVRAAPSIAQKSIAALASCLTAGLQPWGLGIGLSAMYGNKADSGKVRKELENDPLQASHITAAVAELGAACEAAFKACDPTGLPQPLEDVGKTMSAKLKTEVKGNDVLQALEKADYGKVFDEFGRAGLVAVAAATNAHKQLLDASKDAISGKANDALLEDFLAGEKAAEKASREELERISAESDAAKKAGMLAQRIAKMERDAMLLKWSSELVKLGVKGVGMFVGPMAIAGSAISMMENLLKAILRTRDFLKFFNSREDMFRDASPFSAPVAQFIHNSRQQGLHYDLQAACDLVQMTGAILETAGVASGPGAAAAVTAGKIVQGVGAVASSVEDVLYEIQRRYDLSKAWSSYRMALVRPENRKLALIAMKKNATLAKYAVAWGAVIKKDVLVSDFMGKCGLDVETLRDEKTNTALVVKYLEQRLSDDLEVTGRKVPAADWAPANVELTPGCWILAKTRGEKKADLIAADTRSVEGALARFVSTRQALEQTLDSIAGKVAQADAKLKQKPKASKGELQSLQTEWKGYAEEYTEYATALSAIQGAIASYSPQRKSGKSTIFHADMKRVADAFSDEAGRLRDERQSAVGQPINAILKEVEGLLKKP